VILSLGSADRSCQPADFEKFPDSTLRTMRAESIINRYLQDGSAVSPFIISDDVMMVIMMMMMVMMMVMGMGMVMGMVMVMVMVTVMMMVMMMVIMLVMVMVMIRRRDACGPGSVLSQLPVNRLVIQMALQELESRGGIPYPYLFAPIKHEVRSHHHHADLTSITVPFFLLLTVFVVRFLSSSSSSS
jgi:hypothetical protein